MVHIRNDATNKHLLSLIRGFNTFYNEKKDILDITPFYLNYGLLTQMIEKRNCLCWSDLVCFHKTFYDLSKKNDSRNLLEISLKYSGYTTTGYETLLQNLHKLKELLTFIEISTTNLAVDFTGYEFTSRLERNLFIKITQLFKYNVCLTMDVVNKLLFEN